MSNGGYESTTINVQAVGSPTVVLEMIASGPRGPDGLATVKIQQVNSDGVYEELMRTAPYEYDKSDGIFKPPGEAIEPGRLRVEAEVTDLDTLATESSLIAVNDRLDTLVGKLESTLAEVEALVGKDYATQGTLAQVLDKLSSEPSTASRQDVLKAEVEAVKAELQAMKANQLSGDQKVQLSGTMMEIYGATVGERPPADSVPVGAAFVAVRTMNVWISDGSTWQEVA